MQFSWQLFCNLDVTLITSLNFLGEDMMWCCSTYICYSGVCARNKKLFAVVKMIRTLPSHENETLDRKVYSLLRDELNFKKNTQFSSF